MGISITNHWLIGPSHLLMGNGMMGLLNSCWKVRLGIFFCPSGSLKTSMALNLPQLFMWYINMKRTPSNLSFSTSYWWLFFRYSSICMADNVKGLCIMYPFALSEYGQYIPLTFLKWLSRTSVTLSSSSFSRYLILL